MIGYELWDIESRNLLYDFDTLDEALEAARDLTDVNPERYPEGLALAYIDADDKTTWLAYGSAMARMLKERLAG